MKREPDPVEGSDIKRIKVACNNCRRRKIKCDGSNPCLHCSNTNKTCEYDTVREKKTRGKGKTNKKMELKDMNNRLCVLERLLINLTDRLTDKNARSTSPESGSQSSLPSGELQSGESQANELLDYVSQDSSQSELAEGDDTPIPTQTNTAKEQPSNTRPDKQYCRFGIHSAYSIFSKDTLAWLKQKVNDDKCLVALSNIPSMFNFLLKNSSLQFLCPPTKKFILSRGNYGYFSPCRELAFDIIDCYYNDFYLFDFFFPQTQLKDLFEKYYSFTNYKFKYPELIIMNLSLCLCLAKKLPADYEKRAKFPTLKDLDEQKLTELKESFFNNACCYYDKINVVNEGLITVQCIIYMIKAIQTCCACDSLIIYMLSGLLVRYAEELGLNDSKKIENFEDSDLCRRLWWFCELTDIDTSFRTGQPPVINMKNITTNSELDNGFIKLPLNIMDLDFDSLYNIPEQNHTNIEYYMYYHTLLNGRIERYSFEQLFSVEAQNKNQDPDVLYGKLGEINLLVFKLMDAMDPRIRPDIKNVGYEFKQKIKYDFSREASFSIVFLQMFTLSHLIIINRMPIVQQFPEIDEKIREHTRLAHECSRTLLQLVMKFRSCYPLSKAEHTWILFYPFLAFVVVLSNLVIFKEDNLFDDEKSTEEDIKLLVTVAKGFFQTPNVTRINNIEKAEEKLVFYDILIRILLKLLLDFLASDDKDYYDDELREYVTDIKGVLKRLLGGQNARFAMVIKDILNCFPSHNGKNARREPTLSNLINDD